MQCQILKTVWNAQDAKVYENEYANTEWNRLSYMTQRFQCLCKSAQSIGNEQEELGILMKKGEYD